ncbi:DUF1819 family protein [Gordonia aichiensis]|uniref:DUF1819 family protein n=1 Tax=Gordonia aichiensis TaxID=36820 RepID=UPI0032668A0B
MASTDSATSRYALSFTTGGLLVREAVLLTPIHLTAQDWDATRRTAVDDNVLQSATTSANIRLVRETVQRLQAFSDTELEVLIESSPTEQHHLMWAAACRRYELIGDFAEEVLRERFLLMTPTVGNDDFDRFLAGKSLWHPEIDGMAASTRHKLRQNLFRMLCEAGLRTAAGDIVPAVISERVVDLLDRRMPSDLRFFPTTTPFTSGDQVQRDQVQR